MKRRQFLTLTPLLFVTGCGFQLRRSDGIPFGRIYIEAPPGGGVAQRLRSLFLAGGKVKLVSSPAEADAILRISQDSRSKTILSLSGAGRVTEYRLALQVSYSVLNREGGRLAETERIELVRDMTYDDTLPLAKGEEEVLLYRDMDENAAQRIVRRLQALQPA